MKLNEILGMTPLQFKWIDDRTCRFSYDNLNFVICLEILEYKFLHSGKNVNCANVSYGTVESNNGHVEPDQLNKNLVNLGKPRTIISTVAKACLSNGELVSCDVIMLAASDQHAAKRSVIYNLAASEIQRVLPKFKTYHVTKDNSKLVILAKADFDDDQLSELADVLGKTD
jgi:hypothetical protein